MTAFINFCLLCERECSNDEIICLACELEHTRKIEYKRKKFTFWDFLDKLLCCRTEICCF